MASGTGNTLIAVYCRWLQCFRSIHLYSVLERGSGRCSCLSFIGCWILATRYFSASCLLHARNEQTPTTPHLPNATHLSEYQFPISDLACGLASCFWSCCFGVFATFVHLSRSFFILLPGCDEGYWQAENHRFYGLGVLCRIVSPFPYSPTFKKKKDRFRQPLY